MACLNIPINKVAWWIRELTVFQSVIILFFSSLSRKTLTFTILQQNYKCFNMWPKLCSCLCFIIESCLFQYSYHFPWNKIGLTYSSGSFCATVRDASERIGAYQGSPNIMLRCPSQDYSWAVVNLGSSWSSSPLSWLLSFSLSCIIILIFTLIVSDSVFIMIGYSSQDNSWSVASLGKHHGFPTSKFWSYHRSKG